VIGGATDLATMESDARTTRAEIALMRRAVNFMADKAET